MRDEDKNYFSYFYLKRSYITFCLFDLIAFIVWNIKGLRHWVATILKLENQSLWQKLNSFIDVLKALSLNLTMWETELRNLQIKRIFAFAFIFLGCYITLHVRFSSQCELNIDKTTFFILKDINVQRCFKDIPII